MPVTPAQPQLYDRIGPPPGRPDGQLSVNAVHRGSQMIVPTSLPPLVAVSVKTAVGLVG
jgi:hypothetical protein